MSKREKWAVHALVILTVILGIVVVVWVASYTPEEAEPDQPRVYNVDSLRAIHKKLPTVTIVEEDTTYEMDAARFQTMDDSIHYFEDGF